jgi:peptidyl-prolyl cis-trans isomerase C
MESSPAQVRSASVSSPEFLSSRSAPPPGQSSRLRRWLREPLLHFLLLGLALFVVYRALGTDPGQRGPGNRIELTDDDLRQMTVVWLAQGRPPPTPEQMRSLVESKVREEILYREALALGLDQGDTIVKRRLAQKMEFLAEDVSDLREPSREELEAWFAQNAARFELPPRASFRHLYFSPDRRGARAGVDAAQALGTLAGQPADAPAAAALADPFMFQEFYGDRTPEQLAKVFGPTFAQALFLLRPGAWQGPIESGYGWHLVWVESITPGRVPDFEAVEAEVTSEWVAEQRAEFKRQAFEAMRARYEIVLPSAVAKAAAANGTLPVKEAP